MQLVHADCLFIKQHVNTPGCVTLEVANSFFFQKNQTARDLAAYPKALSRGKDQRASKQQSRHL
jgi:hypothetical protein